MKTKLRLTTLLIYLMSLTSLLNAADINNLKMLANQGDKEAQYNLGYCYEYGEGVGKDLREAVNWYTKAANQGHEYAKGKVIDFKKYYGLVASTSTTESTNETKPKSNTFSHKYKTNGRTYIISNAEVDAMEAAYKGYAATLKGKKQRDYIKGYTQILNALREGKSPSASSQTYSGQHFWSFMDQLKPEKEDNKTESGSTSNDGYNLYGLLTRDVYHGNYSSLEKDFSTPFVRTDRNKLDVEVRLDNVYNAAKILGYAGEKTEEGLKEFLVRGNHLSSSEFDNYLGIDLAVVNDKREVASWYTKAANQGDKNAQYNLGECYYYGRGVVVDMREAVSWYTRAAKQGDKDAQNRLGNCYENGEGVVKNMCEAVSWYTKAANQGNEDAQNSLGYCYESGEGVVKDMREAVNWYTKAANQGHEYAKRKVIDLKKYYGLEASTSLTGKAKPPVLDIIPNSVQFIEPSGNGAIDANELSHLRFKVKNSGLGAAYGCMVKINVSGATAGLNNSSQPLPVLAVGAFETIEIPIQASMSTTNGTANFTVQIDEPNGFGTDPIQLAVNTKAFEAPLLKIVDFTVTGDQVGTLVKKRPFDLQLLLQNTQYGTAEDVMVEVKIPAGVYLIDDNKTTKLQVLGGGDKKSLVYSLIVNNNYVSDIIPIEVIISEKYRKYSENKVINLKINQTLASNKIVVDEKPTARSTIQIGSLGSDVDKNIPIIKTINDNVFAVVIANEHYNKVSPVPYALNDGRVFAEYCGKTLGLPAKNIRFVQNATLNDLKYQVDWLRQIIGAYNGKAKVIFYYAGHGIPDESNKTAYLLPIDGYGSDVNTGYKLDDLYATLGKMPTQSVTVILDACFSGTKREGDMLANARGVAIRVKSGLPQGNMVVFTAAQGDETAYPNSEQEHGLFTYYLLKKLQETKGEVSYQQLSDYVTRLVRQQSLVLNGKSQTPTIISSPNIADEWKLWTLK